MAKTAAAREAVDGIRRLANGMSPTVVRLCGNMVRRPTATKAKAHIPASGTDSVMRIGRSLRPVMRAARARFTGANTQADELSTAQTAVRLK